MKQNIKTAEHKLFRYLIWLITGKLVLLIIIYLFYFKSQQQPELAYQCGVIDTYPDLENIEYPVNYDDGATLFKMNCASCHNKNMISKSTGPALGGVTERWESKELLYDWIRNSQAVIATGDKYAVALYEEYNKSQMTAFPNLTDEEIDAILSYIDTQSNISYSY